MARLREAERMARTAEDLVSASEEALAAAETYLERDVRETRLRGDLELADQAHAILAEERERSRRPGC